jgi:hypothetical protein
MKRLYALTAIAILRCGQCLAADVAGSKDDPSLKRIEGSEILYYKASKFDAALFALEKVEFDSGAQALKDTKVLRAEGPARPSITSFHRRPQPLKAFDNMRRS